MTRQAFDQELQRLEDEVLAMGSMVGAALIKSVESLKKRDLAASRALVLADREINARRFSLEEDVLTLIATQQPMAGDMRLLAAVLEILTELERMGDYAKGIARINLMIGDKPLVKPIIDLPVMAEKASGMLYDALRAFIDRDVELARAIPQRDDEVDNLYDQIYRELISYILQDPTTIEQANLLMWAAHNLERTADRVTNLCERVIFMVTGELSELDSDTKGIPSIG
ncbi:MAG: phosphate signaling complex protein PhoU [Anaerolineae bacterium]|nr:phosphate signaling complex protein PhoU [Anaerolineae bacterium]